MIRQQDRDFGIKSSEIHVALIISKLGTEGQYLYQNSFEFLQFFEFYLVQPASGSTRFMYAYCPVNVSRAVGSKNVDWTINDLSNDYFIKDLQVQFPTMLNFLRLLVFEIIPFDFSDSSD